MFNRVSYIKKISVSSELDPNHAAKTPRALKTERTVHRATFNPSKANPGETLYITVPRLDHMLFLFQDLLLFVLI